MKFAIKRSLCLDLVKQNTGEHMIHFSLGFNTWDFWGARQPKKHPVVLTKSPLYHSLFSLLSPKYRMAQVAGSPHNLT